MVVLCYTPSTCEDYSPASDAGGMHAQARKAKVGLDVSVCGYEGENVSLSPRLLVEDWHAFEW